MPALGYCLHVSEVVLLYNHTRHSQSDQPHILLCSDTLPTANMLLLDYQNVLIESILKDRFAPEYALPE